MFNLEGLSGIRKVRWKNLGPGGIVIGGVSIDGNPVPELAGFPVLTERLVRTLLDKYRFLENRDVLIADVLYNFSPFELSETLKVSTRKIDKVNKFRNEYAAGKSLLLKELDSSYSPDKPLLESDFIDHQYFKLDSWNSFTYLYGLDRDRNELPSMFHNTDLKLSVSDLLANRIGSKFNIPEDRDANLHLVLDLSKSMDVGGKLEIAVDALNSIYRSVRDCFTKCKISMYGFSDSCTTLTYPVDNLGLKRGDTNYSSFIKSVLHNRDRDVWNMIILITDGLPTDRSEALKLCQLVKKNSIDYTQIILDTRETMRYEGRFIEGTAVNLVDNIIVDEENIDIEDVILTDDELDNKMKGIYQDFTEIAGICGGNQVILKINKILKYVTVECYDRYIGALSLIEENEASESDLIKELSKLKKQSDGSGGRVKDWKFPTLK